MPRSHPRYAPGIPAAICRVGARRPGDCWHTGEAQQQPGRLIWNAPERTVARRSRPGSRAAPSRKRRCWPLPASRRRNWVAIIARTFGQSRE
jgi:hypothetical protein